MVPGGIVTAPLTSHFNKAPPVLLICNTKKPSRVVVIVAVCWAKAKLIKNNKAIDKRFFLTDSFFAFVWVEVK
jgi:hypothetical protein